VKGNTKAEVRLLRLAEEDLIEILSYLEADNATAAADALTMLEKDISWLEQFPACGKIPEDMELMHLGYRFLVSGNYLVFYKIEETVVLVYRILHAARDYRLLLGAGYD